MLVINADDLGRDTVTTDRTLALHARGVITSCSAMVFMPDSRRAADLAMAAGLETGIHLNFSMPFGEGGVEPPLRDKQQRLISFLGRSKWSQLVYNPILRDCFDYVFRRQCDEFARLFGREPERFDGHRHMHLCANMILDRPIPSGRMVRRSFSFRKGEKNPFNRLYRKVVASWVARHYRSTDHFFSVEPTRDAQRLERIFALGNGASVELMVHPDDDGQFGFLLGACFEALRAAAKVTDWRGLWAASGARSPGPLDFAPPR